MRRTAWLTSLLLGLAVARAALADPATALVQLLRDGQGVNGDLVMFDSPRRGQPSRLVLAARVNAPVARVRAMLNDPEAYRRAIPAFVRAQTLRSETLAPGRPPARLLAWELEIPLWNLEGQLWLRPGPEGVALDLVDGDLAPGRFTLRALPDGGAEVRSILIIDGGAPLKNANWVTRRLAPAIPWPNPPWRSPPPTCCCVPSPWRLNARAPRRDRPAGRTRPCTPRCPIAWTATPWRRR